MNPILIVFYCFELMPVLAGFYYWAKVKDNHFKWFVLYLLYIFLADLTGGIIDIYLFSNVKYYDYFVIPVEFIFFFWLFRAELKNGKNRRLPVICLGVYLAAFLVDVIYFSRHQFPFYSFSYSVGNLLLLILILFFFIELINSNAILSYRQNMMFWINVGLLIYFLGTLPYYGLRNTFVYKYHRLHIIYNYITLILGCIMYLTFTLSFIWGKPNSKSSPL